MSAGRARVAVVGCGWWATQHHIPSLEAYDAADLVALVDTDERKLRAAGERFGTARVFRGHRELIAAGVADAVVIAVPHAWHYPIARDALEAGLHVLVEKPMVLRASEARRLVDLAAASERHLMVGYTYQFTEHARAAREIVRSGRIGELRFVSGLFASMVESYYRGRPQDYRETFGWELTGPQASTYSDPSVAGGGQGQTQVTHPMGMVLWVTGRRVTEVTALMSSFDLAVDLVDAVSYRLDGGALGTMGSTGSLTPGQPQQQELRYYGSKGFVLQDIWSGRLSAYFNDGTTVELDPLGDDERYPAQAPARRLVDLVVGRTTDNPAPGEDAAAVVEFLEAAYESAELGRPVRTLSAGQEATT